MKIAIVGTCESSRLLAPWHDDAWTKWVCGPRNTDVPCADAWFELHAPHELNAPADDAWRQWLAKQEFDVYLQDPSQHPDIPKAKRFPLEDVLAQFPPPHFFTSTIAWMMGFALTQIGIKEIAIFGVDMAHDTEYGLQKPGCHYLAHEARRFGVKVSTPPQSDLLRSIPLYGYSKASPHAQKFAARRAELEASKAKLTKLREELQKMLHKADVDLGTVEGALQNHGWIERTYL